MTKGIFITATGTDVGKTYISGLIVKKLRDYGLNCGYYKPILSGLEKRGKELVAGDCEYVVETSGLNINPMDCVTYSFKNPVSPHLAAKKENIQISIDTIIEGLNNIKKNYDYLVVEGAGGITCPLNLDKKTLLISDIIKILDMDVLIISPSGLGSINYALLTYKYAISEGINVKGFILNNYDKNNYMHIDNKICIEKLTRTKVIDIVGNNQNKLNINEDKLIEIFREI